MTNWKEASDILLRYLRVKTHPLSIKFIKSSTEIPEGVMRPGKMGIKMALCQINTIARRWNMGVGVTPEEVNCAAALPPGSPHLNLPIRKQEEPQHN